ncbi:MAG: zinc ABC transporter substrate-binding protein [Gammaproteobacteria bacterium]|nr:zinc ABC transporter substrate-binding protein [Gammaproteobacteria bacterium]MDE2250674.1 zinc ABC transporter substrate-binding protein [Gammaproteobacteria bacterium]
MNRSTSVAISVVLAVLAWPRPAQAALRVLATTPEWAALTRELGGDKVDVYAATSAFQDVHRVDAKPSLVARARNADLVVAAGADLEVGWLPILLRESGNGRIQPGNPGYFEADAHLQLLEVPTSVDRSLGDVHPQGNPHAHLDARNVGIVATALAARLAALDPADAAYYQARGADFQTRWQAAIKRWEAQAAALRGVPVVVIHPDQAYLCHWLGLVQVAAIEPKPGVPPSSSYLAELVTRLGAAPPKLILRNAYNDPKAADWLAGRIHVPVVLLPYSVGGTPGASDLFKLFDDTINRLTGAIK